MNDITIRTTDLFLYACIGSSRQERQMEIRGEKAEVF